MIIHNGECFVDQHGRTAVECRAQADVAAGYATALRLMCETTLAQLVSDRQIGPRHIRRLEVSAAGYDRLAARDADMAYQLEAQELWFDCFHSADDFDHLRKMGERKTGIPADVIDELEQRCEIAFREAVDRAGFATAQLQRVMAEGDRWLIVSILRRAELDAPASGRTVADLAWSMLISGHDPRLDQQVAA
jgi:hypothetical protein